VQISLPAHVSKKFVTNRTNEVVEVEGQTLVTMPAHQLLRDLAAKQAAMAEKTGEEVEDGGKYSKALNYLPGGLSSKVIRDA
jgi:hypothetical protein